MRGIPFFKGPVDTFGKPISHFLPPPTGIYYILCGFRPLPLKKIFCLRHPWATFHRPKKGTAVTPTTTRGWGGGRRTHFEQFLVVKQFRGIESSQHFLSEKIRMTSLPLSSVVCVGPDLFTFLKLCRLSLGATHPLLHCTVYRRGFLPCIIFLY